MNLSLIICLFLMKFQEMNEFGIRKIFAFGDSYADTGNLHQMWQREPYGVSYRGKPSGRFSDGIIFTDYLAKFLGMKTPVSYHWRKSLKSRLHYGMNFAYGGAGIGQTLFAVPNITAQVDMFERLVNDGVYTKYDLQSSLILVTLSGNDYDAANERGDSALEILVTLVPTLIDQLSVELKRMANLGAKRIAVGTLPPLGCLPFLTQPLSYNSCNSTGNILSDIHNSALRDSLDKLNNETLSTNFSVVDLDNAFKTIFDNKGDSKGITSLYKPCCMGTDESSSCGSLNLNGEKMYTVCNSPQTSFFWDSVHPTQAGWKAVFNALQLTFQEICSFS
ncbi:hypothetical protein M9H77_29480 [Catharanthus roseus]|uniref:Uncharacterized protein n=1 Tax=Catharanthus roseus TaxID=4058 RepID=A0ACB9ZWR0_CATRO|nr:hypothetical protein M9H77_29480 [Catharanthus roseus]